MNRRELIQTMLVSSALIPINSIASPLQITATQKKILHKILEPVGNKAKTVTHGADLHIKDYLTKIRHPNRPHPEDILLSPSQFELLKSVVARFKRVRSTIGHGHFCIITFDTAVKYGKRYSKVGKFTKEELDFLEDIFYTDANIYGFKGSRQIETLTQSLPSKEVYKVPYTGNYLFKGDSLKKYEELKKKIGDELVLTSGIRGITKQFFLYLDKALRYDGNLSLASRSLAPPGYSYHATGDFDVGQKGFGGGNFSVKFTSTEVFQHLASKGYVEYRYDKDNMLGVRYEPWHIKL